MARSDDRLVRFERATELPMLLLSLAIIPLLILPLMVDLSPLQERAVVAADWLIWAVFAAELSVRTYLAPARAAFLRHHWYDVAFVALPFLRPLRVARAGRGISVGRSVLALRRAGGDARRIAARGSVRYALAAATAGCIALAIGVTLAEREADGSSIHDVSDGLWWAAATVTTVGYGDLTPVTALGRGLGLALMLLGIGAFGVITASVAAYFVETGESERADAEQLRRIEAQLERIERALGATGDE